MAVPPGVVTFDWDVGTTGITEFFSHGLSVLGTRFYTGIPCSMPPWVQHPVP